MPVTATVTGGESLIRKLTIMPERMKVRVREAMALQADEIVDMMRRLAGDPGIAASIGWRWGKSAPRGSMAVAAVSSAGGDMAITIFASDWKSAWWEFGTEQRTWKNGKKTGAMPASPFFFVSWRASRKSTKNKIRAAVRKAAKEVSAGG